MEDKLEHSNVEKEEEHLNENANLDESRLSVESEIDGQEKCGEILKNNANIKPCKGGGSKNINILGKDNFIKFFSKKNKNDVFDYQQCFYYAVSRTIENVKGIKFIGKDIQKFAGKDLFNTKNDSEVNSCLCLISALLAQGYKYNLWDYIKNIVPTLLRNIKLPQAKETLKNFQTVVDNDRNFRVPSLLQQIYNSLDNLINGFQPAERQTINKFVCQLFFLIFFTNKLDIKSGNILVQTDNHNMEFIHIDFDDICGRKGMFDTFENNPICDLRTEKLFLESLWTRVSSDELSEYFDEYVEKYTLTEEKLKKIISRTVKNVFRQNYDISNGKQDNIHSDELKQTCRYSFILMQVYMQYMLDQLSEKKILLQGGDEQRKATLIDVLEKNRNILDNMLKNNTIETCVDESIKRYEKLREEVLKEKTQKQSNESIDDDVFNSSTHSNNNSVKQNNESKENNDSNINEQEKSLNEIISSNVSLSYSSSSVDPNNKSNINNELNLNDNLNNDIPKEETNKTNNIYQENNNSFNNNNNDINDSKKENNNSLNINEQEKSLNEIIDSNVPLTYSKNSSSKPNNESNINNNLNLNDNLNNDINLNDNLNLNINNSKKEINNSFNINKQDIIINDNIGKNSQMTSCGEILSNIKDFFTKCCSNCETNNSTDVNIYSLQVGNTRNINQ